MEDKNMDLTKKLPEIKSEFSKDAGHKVSTQKSAVCLHLTTKTGNENKIIYKL